MRKRSAAVRAAPKALLLLALAQACAGGAPALSEPAVTSGGMADREVGGRRLSAEFLKVDLRVFLKFMADVGQVNIVPDADVTGTISLRVSDVPFSRAMDAVLANAGLAARGEGNIIRVAPAGRVSGAAAHYGTPRLPDGEVTLRLVNVPLHDAMLFLADAVDLDVVATGAEGSCLDADLAGVPVGKALPVLAESHGLLLRETAGILSISPALASPGGPSPPACRPKEEKRIRPVRDFSTLKRPYFWDPLQPEDPPEEQRLRPPLQRYEPELLEVAGIARSGGQSPWALLLLPDGSTRTVREGSPVGPRQSAVTRIGGEGVVIEDRMKDFLGNDVVKESFLPLGGAR